MEENITEALNDCRDKLEEISGELCVFAETKKLADRLDRLIRDLETIIDDVSDNEQEY